MTQSGRLLPDADSTGVDRRVDPNAPLTTGSYRAGRCGLLLSRAESIRRWFQHARSEALRQHRSEDERDRQRGGAGYADLRIGGSTFYSNSRWGVTVSRDLGVHNPIKAYYSSDLTVSSGNEFKTYGLLGNTNGAQGFDKRPRIAEALCRNLVILNKIASSLRCGGARAHLSALAARSDAARKNLVRARRPW